MLHLAASGPLRPDPFQGLVDIVLAQGSCQVPLPLGRTDPTDLQSVKDQGKETSLVASPVQAPHRALC